MKERCDMLIISLYYGILSEILKLFIFCLNNMLYFLILSGKLKFRMISTTINARSFNYKIKK